MTTMAAVAVAVAVAKLCLHKIGVWNVGAVNGRIVSTDLG